MHGRRSFAIALVSIIAAARLMADCSPAVTVQVPVTACKSGTATAAVLGVPGASYAWTIDGGTIVGDATGDHIVLSLGTAAKTVVSVTMTTAGCVSHGAGLITLRAPFDVHVAAIPAARASEPLTVSWSYDNGTPAQQTISGDFGTVSLPPAARSYSYTPQTSGNKQFVIDATLAGTAVVTAPATRQRAVSKSPVTASTCSTAHTAVPYQVDACSEPPVIVDGPSSVVVGTSFQLSVRSQPGAVATWTIANGSPSSATGDSVTIMPASIGSVDVNVQLTRGACIGQLARSIAVTPKLDCDNPKVSVSTGALSCGSAIVNATFMGAPPFHGKWSDGLSFNTDTMSLAREVAIPGNYSITEFQDAACSGPPSNIAIVPQLIPTATVFGFRGCTSIDSVNVQFTGKPPFSGCWNDGTCFQTNQSGISKLITAEGTNTLVSGTDATGCSLAIAGSVQGVLTPRVMLTPDCLWSPGGANTALLLVQISGSAPGQGGVGATWSDGVKSIFGRFVSSPAITTYTIASIDSGLPNSCPAIFDTPRSYTYFPAPVPDITFPAGSICGGTVGTASVTPPPPGTQVNWVVSGGTILSGQGTSTIQYQAGSSSQVYFICTFTFSDPKRCPLTSDIHLPVVPFNPDGTVRVNPSAIVAGKTADVSFTFNKDTVSWSISNTLNDPITMSPCFVDPTTQTTACNGVYTSTHGPVSSTVTVHLTSSCGGTKDVSTVLSIVAN
ncbi:MAG TPA: hypothetical protein VN380_08335 [Thermoanaerobaculia bacterium]|nr:hypothetical protein [Thermoanaerobaculia bacterium]